MGKAQSLPPLTLVHLQRQDTSRLQQRAAHAAVSLASSGDLRKQHRSKAGVHVQLFLSDTIRFEVPARQGAPL